MSDLYRTYNPQWNRTGHAAEPQYSGQERIMDGMDFPAVCPECKSGYVAFGGVFQVPGGVMICQKGHQVVREKIVL